MSAEVRRVLMTADCVGGVWTYSLELTAGLAAHDIEVTLLVMGRRLSRHQAQEAAGVPGLHLIERDLKLEWMDDPERDLRAADDLLIDLEARFEPDIVHVNGYANAAAGFRAPVVAVAHSCVATWWSACGRGPMQAGWKHYLERLGRGAAAADCLVAPTDAMLDAFVAAHGAVRRAAVIHNGRTLDVRRERRRRPEVFAVGRLWDEAKNIPKLCEAARHHGWPVAIAGEGDIPDDAPANVVALGQLGADSLVRRMAGARVFAAPARYEPFGLATLEAALCGCALVLGDIPSQRELWDGAAAFVDPDDSRMLAAEIDRLMADPRLASRRGRAARRRASRYGRAAMAQRYLALYREMAGAAGWDARPLWEGATAA